MLISPVDELSQSQETTRINEPALSQPICTALQVALTQLLSDWGIEPAVVVGHSSGEIAVSILSKPPIVAELKRCT